MAARADSRARGLRPAAGRPLLCRDGATHAPTTAVWLTGLDDSAGFHQRVTGEFQDDGGTIIGRWEASEDGSTWEYVFDVRYSKIV
jgi:hypothetical protein